MIKVEGKWVSLESVSLPSTDPVLHVDRGFGCRSVGCHGM